MHQPFGALFASSQVEVCTTINLNLYWGCLKPPTIARCGPLVAEPQASPRSTSVNPWTPATKSRPQGMLPRNWNRILATHGTSQFSWANWSIQPISHILKYVLLFCHVWLLPEKSWIFFLYSLARGPVVAWPVLLSHGWSGPPCSEAQPEAGPSSHNIPPGVEVQIQYNTIPKNNHYILLFS